MGAFDKLNLVIGPHADGALDNPYRGFSVKQAIIQYPGFCRALKEIADLHQQCLESKNYGGLLITGQTGSGKTTVLKYYQSFFPVRNEPERRVVPVLLVTTPAVPTVKNLAEAILIALGDPAASKGTAEAKTTRIYRYLKECKVEVLMIDEFQHFYDSRKVSQARNMTDWLKNLFNEAEIPVVLAGLPRAFSVIRMNPQLQRRFSSPYYLEPFGFDTKEQQKEFRAILKAVHNTLPLPSVELYEANLAQRFYFASLGLFDYVAKVIDKAVKLAGEYKLKSLTVGLFARAFAAEVWRGVPKRLNPFDQKAILRPLKKRGEPFEIWEDPSHYEK